MSADPQPRPGDVVSRTLDRRFVIRCEDEAVRAALGFLACDPVVDGPPPRMTLIEIVPVPGGWRILEDGQADVDVGSPRDALDHLHIHLFNLSLADRPGAPMLHTASLVRNGRRVLVVAAKGTGKTTLTLSLAANGFTLEGDENVFVTRRGVVARPRGCRVKENSLPFLPAMRHVIEASPFIVEHRGARIFNLDPRRLGATWSIAEGPVDALLLLTANHGGLTTAREISATTMMSGLVPEMVFQTDQKGAAIAQIAALATTARRYDVSVGSLDGACDLVEGILVR